MTMLRMEGFEDDHISIGDVFVGTISTVKACTGFRSGLFASPQEGIRIDLGANYSELYVKFHIYITNGGNSNCTYNSLTKFIDEDGHAQGALTTHFQTNKALYAYRGASSAMLAASYQYILPNVWNLIEIRYKCDDAPNGRFVVKLNREIIIDYTGDTKEQATTNIRYVEFSAPTATANCQGYYDDIVINDTSGAQNNSWPGDGGVRTLRPNGAGSSTDLGLVPNSGEANYEDVDDATPDEDTTYVYGSTVDDHDSYALENLPLVGDTIRAVQWAARARLAEGGNGEIARILRINGSDYQGVDMDIVTAWKYYRDILEINPDDAAAWDKADIDGMEIGVKIR